MAEDVEGVNGVVQVDNKLFITCGCAHTILHDDPIFVQVGCQSSLDMSVNRPAWKCSHRFFSDVMKKGRFYCDALSCAVKQGAPLWICK